MAVYGGVHDAVFDLHVSTEVSLQVELAGAVRALEWLAAGMEVHVAEEVVHPVERLPAHLGIKSMSVSSPSLASFVSRPKLRSLHSPCT